MSIEPTLAFNELSSCVSETIWNILEKQLECSLGFLDSGPGLLCQRMLLGALASVHRSHPVEPAQQTGLSPSEQIILTLLTRRLVAFRLHLPQPQPDPDFLAFLAVESSAFQDLHRFHGMTFTGLPCLR